MESWWPDPFHVPPLARTAVPTQTTAVGRSDAPTAASFFAPCAPHAHPTDRMKNKPNICLRQSRNTPKPLSRFISAKSQMGTSSSFLSVNHHHPHQDRGLYSLTTTVTPTR